MQPPSAMVLTGARGLGKTVTLAVIADAAAERGFVTVNVAFDSVSGCCRRRTALIEPALALGVTWEPAAAEAIRKAPRS